MVVESVSLPVENQRIVAVGDRSPRERYFLIVYALRRGNQAQRPVLLQGLEALKSVGDGMDVLTQRVDKSLLELAIAA